MLPALRLPLLTAGLLLISSPAALAAAPSIPVPAEGQVSVTFASGVKRVKVKSAPAGVTVAGGVKKGKLVVAVVRPRGVAAKGRVLLSVKGKAKGIKTIAAALNGGKAPNCKDLSALASRRLKGSANVKGLGALLASKLCGRPAPAGADALLARLGLGVPALPAPGGDGGARPSTGGGAPRPAPTPGGGGGGGANVCANGVDDDNDGQIDLDDPGCANGSDTSETGEVPVSQECIDNHSGVGMGSEPRELFIALNGCGPFTKARIDIAPGIAQCTALTGGGDWDCKPAGGTYALATAKDGKPVDTMDVPATASGPVKCDRKATIALYRPNGEVAELYVAISNCNGGDQPVKSQCANGIDDDGDGMADYHFLETATDPDPGCSSEDDNSEASELLPAGDCQIVMDVLESDPKVAAAVVQGCGAIQGFWFVTPGTPIARECLFRIGGPGDPIEECWVLRGHVGTMFERNTTQPLVINAAMTAAGDCRPMTFALINADNTVTRQRMRRSGC